GPEWHLPRRDGPPHPRRDHRRRVREAEQERAQRGRRGGVRALAARSGPLGLVARVARMDRAMATDDAPVARVRRYRWLVCALLFLAAVINYMDRQILSLLKPLLDTELGWTNEQFGQINAAFQAAYAIGLLLFGAFIDRFGTRIGYAVSLLAW